MPTTFLAGLPPVAATMDLQHRLPPMQNVIFTPTILVSIVLLGLALVVMGYLARRSRAAERLAARQDALRMMERILVKRGGTAEDVDRMQYVFQSHAELDPAASVMVRERFRDDLRPHLDAAFGPAFAERMEKIYFPPPKDTRKTLATAVPAAAPGAGDSARTGPASAQASAAIMDLMDATLRPGALVRMTFTGLQGGYDCLVMGHDSQAINITLPANNDRLVTSLRPGMKTDGTMESGPSLLAFTSRVIQAVAGSMPYCRITPWQTVWEVRKRDSVRLPISLDIDLQHISTATAGSIKMATLEKEIGTLRPGKLMDISLGGCCIETPSSASFQVGDMVRFSKPLITGNPPAPLLGAVVNIDAIDPGTNDGSVQRLHVQFLVIDDVSQRILVRTLRQLQDITERDEWMLAQQMLQKMRRAKIAQI
ncbi:MAG: PilZ domain-containing protein, partial [Planctomycetes bacterium]|nr:PilZ domain-containing protein [Planctomycetota bacterium]